MRAGGLGRGAIALLAATLLAGCGGDAGPGPSPASDAAAEMDTAPHAHADGPPAAAVDATVGPSDAPGVDGAPDAPPDALPFLAIAPCGAPADYAAGALAVGTLVAAYSPPCLRVPVGAQVTIEASALHPLEPRPGGSPGNPIVSQQASLTVTFTSAGFFPFECPEHVDQGMLGVVWVTP